MKNNLLVYVGLIVISTLLLWGCEDSPKPQVSEARQALEDARQAGAAEKAPELLSQAEQHFQNATDELQAQDDQFGLFRNYSKAKDLLEKTEATALQAKTKSQAQANLGVESINVEPSVTKEEVERAITEARMVVREAKELLTKAPPGKDVELVLQIMDIDIRSAESTLAEIPKEVPPQDYTIVKAKAEEVQNVATQVRDQILQAIRKAEGQRS